MPTPFECQPGECFALYDVAKAAYTYSTNQYWATFSTQLPDGRTFGLNMGDGVGVQYTGNDRSSEDFVILGGKHLKLDLIRITYDENDYKNTTTFKSVEE